MANKPNGIDFGKKPTCLATRFENRTSRFIENRADRLPYFPSVVYFPRNNFPVFGKDTLDEVLTEPDRIVQNIKSSLGYHRTPGWQMNGLKPNCTIEGKPYTVKELSTLSLRHLGDNYYPGHCKVIERVYTSDPDLQNTIAESHNTGFFIENYTLVPEQVYVNIYKGTSIDASA